VAYREANTSHGCSAVTVWLAKYLSELFVCWSGRSEGKRGVTTGRTNELGANEIVGREGTGIAKEKRIV
jgi:hypothetical protein